MKYYYPVNKKGFINAFTLFLFTFILMLAHVYVLRYQTLYKFQKLKESGMYCELFVFQHIRDRNDELEDDDVEINDNDDEDMEDTESDDGDTMEQLQFRDCTIELMYHSDEIAVEYQIDQIHQSMIIAYNHETKEIMDVAYENRMEP